MATDQAETYVIDTSTPFLWMPEAICDNFASLLNLTYNETLQLYLFDGSSSPDLLTGWDLSFNFSLGNLAGSLDNVELTLPYEAFNLQLSYPFPNLDATAASSPINYFPLRKANDTQFIIGRMFLQETYLTVDYERKNFSLSQAVFTEDAVNNVALYSITRPSDSIFPGPPSTASGLSTAAKAGIGAGVGVVAILAAGVIWWHCFRKRRDHALLSPGKSKRRSVFHRWSRSPGSNVTVSELLGDKRHPAEVAADATTSRYELASHHPIEMPAAEVPATFYQSRDSMTGSMQRNDPRNPAELDHTGDLSKQAEAAARPAASDRSGSPVPPYSPAELRQRFSSSISPNSPHHSHAFGTASSGEQGISPVGNSSGNSPNSQRNSGNISSPVSPVATMPRFHSRPENGRSDSQSPTSSSGPYLNPHDVRRAPSRSPSRGSRFVEEGLSNVPAAERVHTPSGHSARFSWEE
jgi:hypothetical protein